MKKHKYKLISTKHLMEERDNTPDCKIENNISKMLKETHEANKYLGIEGIKRFTLLDFSRDLIAEIMPIENRMLLKNKIQPNHYLYNKIMEKNSKLPSILRFQTAKHLTMAYIEHDGHEQWNKKEFMSEYDQYQLIKEELLWGGVSSYNILKKVFNDEDFENFLTNMEPENLSKKDIYHNLKEMLYTHIITDSRKMARYLLLNKEIESLNISVDMNKILNNINIKNINYQGIIALNDNDLNNTMIDFKFPEGKKSETVLNISKYLFMDYSLSHMMNGRNAWDLNGKEFSNPNELLNKFKEDPFLAPLIKPMFESKIKKSTSAEVRANWHFVYMNEYLQSNNNIIKSNHLKI